MHAGDRRPLSAYTRHDSLGSAEREAMRLAIKENESFYIMEAIGGFKPFVDVEKINIEPEKEIEPII